MINKFKFIKKFLDFEIILSQTQKIRCFKSVLSGDCPLIDAKSEKRSISLFEKKFPKGFTISENLLLKILLGYNIPKLEGTKYFNIFVFFNNLGMKKYMLLICKEVEKNVKNTRELLDIFSKSYIFFENRFIRSSEENQLFKSSFSLMVFNLLKKNGKILSQKIINHYKVLKESSFLLDIQNYTTKPIIEHSDFKNEINFDLYKKISSNSFFISTFSDLYIKKQYFNVVLNGRGGTGVQAHLEYILIRNKFFLDLFVSEFSELKTPTKENIIELKVNTLSKKEIIVVLEYLYFQKIKSMSLEIILKLLGCSNIMFYRNDDFENKLFEKFGAILKKSKKKLETILFEKIILIQKLGEKQQEKVFRFFEELGLKKQMIKNLVDYSTKVQLFVMKLENENIKMDEKISKLETIIFEKNKDLEKMEGKIKKLKKK